MPGDPLRAKIIAETYLPDAQLVNNVRGVQGYTGTYQRVPVSVMASGMGMPSMGVYSCELFREKLSAGERQASFSQMMELALNVVVELDK